MRTVLLLPLCGLLLFGAATAAVRNVTAVERGRHEPPPVETTVVVPPPSNNNKSSTVRQRRRLPSSPLPDHLPIRINCGDAYTVGDDPDMKFQPGQDNSYIDTDGQITYSTAYSSGQDDFREVPSSTPWQIYRSHVQLYTGTYLTYQIPIPESIKRLRVRIHFMERSSAIDKGDRIFNVNLDGKRNIFDLDIRKRTGSLYNAYVWEGEVDADKTDDVLDIQFVKVVGSPTVCAIEVFPIDFPKKLDIANTGSTTLYNFAENAFDTDEENFLVQVEQTYTYSISSYYTIAGLGETNFEADLYRKNRYGKNFLYVVPLPREIERVLLRLHFIEYTTTSQGQRVFDVVVNGQVLLYHEDLIKQVGARFKAYRWTGFLDLDETAQDAKALHQLKIELIGRLKSNNQMTYATIAALEVLSPSTSVDTELISKRTPHLLPHIQVPESTVIEPIKKYAMGATNQLPAGPWLTSGSYVTSLTSYSTSAQHSSGSSVADADPFPAKLYWAWRSGYWFKFALPLGSGAGPGLYFLRLHFFQRSGDPHPFDILVQDELREYGLNLYKAAGKDSGGFAYRLELYTEVKSGETTIDLELRSQDGHRAEISGCEIFSAQAMPTAAPTPKPTYGPCRQEYHRRTDDGACVYDSTMCHHNSDCSYPESNWCDLTANICKIRLGREDPPACTSVSDCHSHHHHNLDCIHGHCRVVCQQDEDCFHTPITATGLALTCYSGDYCAQPCNADSDCVLPLGKCDAAVGTCVAIE